MSEQTEGIAYVYCLMDPRTDDVRYVGCSLNPEARMSAFRRASGGGKNLESWLAELKAEGLEPTMQVVEETEKESRSFREEFWIRHFGSHGAQLVNKEGIVRKF